MGVAGWLSSSLDQALVAAGLKVKVGPLKLSTVVQRVAVLSTAHKLKRLANPCELPSIRTLLSVIRELPHFQHLNAPNATLERPRFGDVHQNCPKYRERAEELPQIRRRCSTGHLNPPCRMCAKASLGPACLPRAFSNLSVLLIAADGRLRRLPWRAPQFDCRRLGL